MANIDRPNGFTPIGTISGGDWRGKVRSYATDANTAADLATGAVVVLEAAGNLEKSAGTGVALGVVVGVEPIDRVSDFGSGANAHGTGLNLEDNFFDQSTGNYKRVLVAVGSDVLYEVQTVTGTGGGGGVADIGTHGDGVGAASGTSRSIMELAAVGTGTAQWNVVDVVRRPDNALGSTHDRYIVSLHENQFADALAGI